MLNQILNSNKFHYFKFQLWDGSWRTYWNPSPQRLKKIIPELNPKNIYISVNKWLRYKEHNKTYPNILLEKNILLDIDSQDFVSSEEAISYFNKILSFLQKKKIKISEINMTNIYGGFQIIIHHFSYNKFYYLLTASLSRGEGLFAKIDWKVMNDDKRVRRYAPSWNDNKNCYSIPLFSEPSFFHHPYLNGWVQSQSKDLNITKLINIQSPLFLASEKGFIGARFHALGMPQIVQNFTQPLEPVLAGKPSKVAMSQDYFEADDNAVGNNTTPPSEQRHGQASRANLPCHFLVRQISNSVYGSSNNYVSCLKFPIKPSLKRIRRLQKAYSLGDVYLLQNHIGFVAISPKVCQKERLYKIYKKAGCWKSLNELQKFKQNWIYCSNIFNLQTKQTEQTFKFLDVIENEADGWYSRPHLYWLSRFHKKEYPENRIIGSEPKIYTALQSER